MIQTHNLINLKAPKSKGVAEIVFTPSEEAKICLNCDLPECENRGPCRRFKEAKRKLREGNV